MPKRKSLWWNPWEQVKASTENFLYAIRDGRLYLPWLAILEGLKYSYKYNIRGVKPPRGPGLEVPGTENDTVGFAVYGLVRVSGVNVIPP